MQPETDRAQHLVALAEERFGTPLVAAECKVLHESASSSDTPPENGSQDRPLVRPEFLRWLTTDRRAADYIDPKGIRVVSATVSGPLDLSFCDVSSMLVFHSCTFLDHLLLLHATLRGLGIYNSKLTEGIIADGAIVRGPVFLGAGFQSSGPLNFHSVRIEGAFTCQGALLPVTGHSLSLEGATIDGQVALTNGFRSCGEIRMIGCHIAADLNCSGASLNANAGSKALSLDRADVHGRVDLSTVHATGTLSLNGIEVDGQFDCRDSVINTSDTALSLDGAKLHDYVSAKGMRTTGAIRLVGANLDSSLDCSGVVLKVSGNALWLDRAQIRGSIYLNGLRSDGAVRMAASGVQTNLYCGGAQLAELYCMNMKLDGELWWGGIRGAEHTKLTLTGATLLYLRDEMKSWPSKNNLKLSALTYEGLYSHASATLEQWETNNLPDPLPLSVNERIEWLNLQATDGELEQQPWFQLSKLFAAIGRAREAKHVIHTLRLEQAKVYWPPHRCWAIAVAWLEEDLFRVLWSLALVIALGVCIYWPAQHSIAPTDRAAYAEWAHGQRFQVAYPKFQPFVYATENAIPIVKLGQDDKWAPDPNGPLLVYWALVSFRWILIALGWLQATLLAAAVNQRFKS